MKHIRSITFSVLFLASTVSVTFHINLNRATGHIATTKQGKKNYHNYRNTPREKLVLLKETGCTKS
jgi:hypothetical protein